MSFSCPMLVLFARFFVLARLRSLYLVQIKSSNRPVLLSPVQREGHSIPSKTYSRLSRL